MSEAENTNKAAAKRVLEHFFLPLDEKSFFCAIDEATGRCLPLLLNLVKAFRRNLEAVMLTASVPFQLTAASVRQLNFQRIHIAERIRARKLLLEGVTEESAEQEALAKARVRFADEVIHSETVTTQIITELEASLAREEFGNAASELLRQGAVSAWGALEVLVQDVFVALLNAKPNLAVELLTNERTKNIFQLKAIPLDTLVAQNFNLSDCFGEILIRSRSVDTIPTMKGVFRVLLPTSENLKEALEQKELWMLNQKRHLIVHRRGIVDASYIGNTGDALDLGSELTISPAELEQYLNLIADTGVKLIEEVSDHYK